MPRNRTHKTADGRYTYKVTDKAGQVQSLKSYKGERESDFKKRCDKLDRLCDFEIKTDTFHDLFTSWRTMYLEQDLSKGDAAITIKLYESFVMPRIGRLKLSDLTPPTIYGLLNAAKNSGWSRSTVSKVKGIVSRPFMWAIENLGLNMIPPTAAVRFRMERVKKPKRRRHLTDQEVDRFLTAAGDSKYADMYRLMLLLGLRPSEALGLQVKDIKPPYLKVRRAYTQYGVSDGKTDNAPRDIKLPPEALDILKKLKSDMAFYTPDGWLFPAEGQNEPNMTALISAFKRTVSQTAEYDRGGRNGLKKLALTVPAIKASPYDLRHTFATRMVAAGMPVVTLQRILGHAKVETTLTYYTHVTDDMIDDAVKLMSLKSGPKSGPKNENRTNSENDKTLEA